MKNDPFALLGVGKDATNADLSNAFGQATRGGVSLHDARTAFNELRHPDSREAMSILAISQAPGFARVAHVDDSAAAVQASELVIGALSAALADLASDLDAEMPGEPIARDVRDYVPPPMEDLEP